MFFITIALTKSAQILIQDHDYQSLRSDQQRKCFIEIRSNDILDALMVFLFAVVQVIAKVSKNTSNRVT